MNKLEIRKTELLAEMEICKLAIRIQRNIDMVEECEKAETSTLTADESKRNERRKRRLQQTIIKMFEDIKKALRVKTPEHGNIPANWRAWVREWNLFCFTHNRDRYTLYVHSND